MARKLQPHEKDMYAVVSTTNELVDGRSNNTGQVTLNPGATTTAVTFANASLNSTIVLSPLNPDAATVQWYIYSKANGSFVVGHPSSALTNQDFDFSCVGG